MASTIGSPPCPKCEKTNTYEDYYYKVNEFWFDCFECGYGCSQRTVDWNQDPPQDLPDPIFQEHYGTVVFCPDCNAGVWATTSWSKQMTKFEGYSYWCESCGKHHTRGPDEEPLVPEPPRFQPDDEKNWVECEGRCGIWTTKKTVKEEGPLCRGCKENNPE